MENPNTSKGNLLAHEVNIKLNMLRPSMVHRVGGEVDRADVIALERTARASLMAKHPLARDDVGTKGSRNKLPRVVAL